MTVADRINHFNVSLSIASELPEGVEVMNPYLDEEAYRLSALFYSKFFNDNNHRTGVFGINPGRFGAGVTGVPFTDPVKLENDCGIPNHFEKRGELSSDFVYRMIDELGGPEAFYSKYFLTAICPLGFVKDGKNMNYYDSADLLEATEPFIIETINQQLEIGLDREKAYCLGQGKNMKYFEKINRKHHFFKEIIPLAHPRYIMQYKRKQLNDYLAQYRIALKG